MRRKATEREGILLGLTGLIHASLYVSREYQQAIPWLENAANAGQMRAPLVLGILYEQGSGVKEDAATSMIRLTTTVGHG